MAFLKQERASRAHLFGLDRVGLDRAGVRRWLLGLAGLTGLCGLAVGYSAAGGNTGAMAAIADPIIEACWQLSEVARAGTTMDQITGTQVTQSCLETAIMDQMAVLVGDDPDILAASAGQLQQIADGLGGLYYTIYNLPVSCRPACGTMWRTFPGAAVTQRFEDILRDTIQQILDQGLTPAPGR